MPEGVEPRARHFYGGVLGMREVEKPGELGGRGGCWFELGGCTRPIRSGIAWNSYGPDTGSARLDARMSPIVNRHVEVEPGELDVPFRGAAVGRLMKCAHSLQRKRRAYGLWLLGLLVVSSCISIPIPGRGSETSGETVSWKAVVEKRGPNLLIAVDRTYCEVAQDRFDEVDVGERVLCHWR